MQTGNGYLENRIEVKIVDNTIFTKADQIRLKNIGLAYNFDKVKDLQVLEQRLKTIII